jgi:hypothetical protein
MAKVKKGVRGGGERGSAQKETKEEDKGRKKIHPSARDSLCLA